MLKVALVITILSINPSGQREIKETRTLFSTVAECHKVMKELGFPKSYPSFITMKCELAP